MSYFDFLWEDTIFPINHFWCPFALYLYSQNIWLTLSMIFIAESAEELFYTMAHIPIISDILPNVKMNESSGDSLLLDPLLGIMGILGAKLFINQYQIKYFITSQSKKYIAQIGLLVTVFFSPLLACYGIGRIQRYPGRRYLRLDVLVYTISYSLWLLLIYLWNKGEEWTQYIKNWWYYFLFTMLGCSYLLYPPLISFGVVLLMVLIIIKIGLI